MMKYLVIGRRAKELNELSDKYKALEANYRGMHDKKDLDILNLKNKMNDEETKHKQDIDALYTSLSDNIVNLRNKLNDETTMHKQEIDALHASLATKDETIRNLQSKIDILYEYYDMDEEPSQEIKTKMRINERIHDLELENIELRNNMRMRDEVQKQLLTCAFGQARSNFSASQTAFLPHVVTDSAFGRPYYL